MYLVKLKNNHAQGRAHDMMDYGEDADDEDDDMDEVEDQIHGYDQTVDHVGYPHASGAAAFDTAPGPTDAPGASTSALLDETAPFTSSGGATSSSPPVAAPYNAELMLVFMRKVDGLSRTLRDQSAFLRDLQEGNRLFQ